MDFFNAKIHHICTDNHSLDERLTLLESIVNELKNDYPPFFIEFFKKMGSILLLKRVFRDESSFEHPFSIKTAEWFASRIEETYVWERDAESSLMEVLASYQSYNDTGRFLIESLQKGLNEQFSAEEKADVSARLTAITAKWESIEKEHILPAMEKISALGRELLTSLVPQK